MGDNHQDGATAHLFAPIQAPKIKSISRKAIQDFIADREAYEDSVAAQPGLKPVSYRSCFPASFLRSLVRAKLFGPSVTDVSELSDSMIKAKLQEWGSGFKAVSAEEALAEVKKHVRLDAQEHDARLRVMMLSASYIELCDKRGWEFVEKSQKAAIQHIISVLQPPRLKTRVEDAIQLERLDLRSDYFGFMEFLAEKAVIFEEVEPLREYRSGNSKKGKKDKKGETSDGGSQASGNSASTGGKGDDKSKKGKLPDCLNPKCKEKHFLKDCSITDQEQRKTLLEQHRENKKKNAGKQSEKPPQVSALIAPVSGATATNEGSDTSAVITAEISGHTFACRIDSGADADVISETIVDFLGDQGIYLPSIRPKTGVTSNNGQPFKSVDGHDVNCPGRVQVSPLIQTVAGPCRLRNITAIVMNDADSFVKPGHACAGELILGNPFLLRAGLDVKDFLANNIEHLASIDYGEVQHEDSCTKVGKFGMSLLSKDIEVDEATVPTTRLSSMIANGDFPLRDGDDVDYKDVDVGVSEDRDNVDSSIDDMIATAIKKLPEDQHDKLRSLIEKHRDIFRTQLTSGPAVDVPPMNIEFEGVERPVKVRQRTYSPDQLAFLKKKVKDLEDAGFIYRNNGSKWACAPLVVPKPGSKEGFRFTVDLRPVNAQTKTNVWPLPHPEAMMSKLKGSKVYFNVDFLHGYWQFLLAVASQECMSFHTPFGVYTPYRVQHGAKNSNSYFQSSMESIFGHLEILIFVDDLLGYASSYDELLDKLRMVFELCSEKNLKINPKKCTLVSDEVKFCGRIINANGVKFSPRHYEALTNMAVPTTVGALMELVHCANWMRSAIPNFSVLIAPLQKLLEECYKLHNTRKKARLIRRPISAWGDEHQSAFSSLIRAIENQATLVTPDPEKRLCLFTDGSISHWSGVLTQVARHEHSSAKEPQHWNHAPVAFVSGEFRNASERWTIPEKESYAIVSSVIRLAHVLVSCDEFSLFTDHKNILYMMSPNRFDSSVARHIVHKVQRWALRLAEFNFTIEHIPGEQNVWADILTRWAAKPADDTPSRRMSALRVPMLHSAAPNLPSMEDIAKSQSMYPPDSGLGYKRAGDENSLWVSEDGKVYVPAEDEEMLLRICVSAHCGLGGHRGYTTTKTIIQEKLHWPTMDSDVKVFVQSCLVCLLSSSGSRVPRPLGHQMHAERVNELLHFDFLYIGQASDSSEYILILKDDFSGYVFLRACKSADADTTAEVLLEYFSTFVPVLNWFSDQGSHFKNDVMAKLAASMGAKHRYSTAYVPWSNGTVEAVCKQVLRVMRAFSAEFQVPEADWPKCVPAIQSIINNSTTRRLGNRAPITVHTGMDAGNPLQLALQSASISDVSDDEAVAAMSKIKVDELLKALECMHKEVAESLSESRKRSVDAHNARTHIRQYNPTVGDYVVVARTRGPRTKVSANWVGPRRVAKVLSDFTCEVEHLVSSDVEVVHVSRMQLYADDLVGKEVELQEAAEFSDRVWQVVEKLKDIRETTNGMEVLVSWKGLSSAGDTWEPLMNMHEDVPVKVREFLSRRRSSAVIKKAKTLTGL